MPASFGDLKDMKPRAQPQPGRSFFLGPGCHALIRRASLSLGSNGLARYKRCMQFRLRFGQSGARSLAEQEDWLLVNSQRLPLVLVAHRRARRYVMRLRSDGAVRVTVPHGGSVTEAKRFAERNIPWVEEQIRRQAVRGCGHEVWKLGSSILFRGERALLERELNGQPGWISFVGERFPVADINSDLRPEVENHLWRLARRELADRVWELSKLHQLSVQRVSVRNQRSRWGSCSQRGTISLNWRLVQTPPFVRDYIILHELAHGKEMNHSHRFWAHVGRLCPNYREAEGWLKQHPELLKRQG